MRGWISYLFPWGTVTSSQFFGAVFFLPLKTITWHWKIPMFNRNYIFIHSSCIVHLQILVFGGVYQNQPHSYTGPWEFFTMEFSLNNGVFCRSSCWRSKNIWAKYKSPFTIKPPFGMIFLPFFQPPNKQSQEFFWLPASHHLAEAGQDPILSFQEIHVFVELGGGGFGFDMCCPFRIEKEFQSWTCSFGRSCSNFPVVDDFFSCFSPFLFCICRFFLCFLFNRNFLEANVWVVAVAVVEGCSLLPKKRRACRDNTKLKLTFSHLKIDGSKIILSYILCYFKKGNDNKPYIHYPNWKWLLPPSGDVLSLGFIPYLFDSYKAMRAMHDSKWVLHAGVSEKFRWAGDSTVSSADIVVRSINYYQKYLEVLMTR